MENNLIGIKKNVLETQKFCEKYGFPFKKPLLVLGTFERVGSNWLLDTLNQCAHTHNEPFKQQLGKDSDYSTMSSQLQHIESSSSNKIHPFSSYWMETFVSTKYGTDGHVIKETNLFFAIKNFIALFPDSPILILKREPLGIFSSFVSQDLFCQWHYEERYYQLRQVSLSDDWKQFKFIFDDVNKESLPALVILARLLFLNSLLIAFFLGDRPYEELAYEAIVENRLEVLKFLSTKFFPSEKFLDVRISGLKNADASHGTFSTLHEKSILEAFLDNRDKQNIYSELDRLITLAVLSEKGSAACAGQCAMLARLQSTRLQYAM